MGIMKDFNDFPLEIKLSFHRVIEELELRMENSKSSISTAYLESLLKYLANFPDLYEGLSDFDKLDDYKEPITVLLESLFPAALTKNEIKAASVPFHNLLFNPTARLAKILEDAGDAYELSIKNINENQFYIIGCIVILKAYYGYNIDPSKPIFYEIPAKNGLVRHYRASMNADFVSFEPTEKAVDITEKEMEELLNNVDDVSLWRKYFPPKSWVLKGVSILNFTDVTLATVDNQQIEVHKVILSSYSQFFRNILLRNPHPNPLLYLKDIRFKELEMIIKFIYLGQGILTKTLFCT